MSLFKYVNLIFMLLFLSSCSSSEDRTKKELIIPNKITLLFITQPHCPACDRLEETMKLEGVKDLLDNYFNIRKVYYGEKLPEGILPPSGTPTVYFLGANSKILTEKMIGQKNEEELMEYLQDALTEFKNIYHVDLIDKHENQPKEKSEKK
jgi:hypothetical protein